MKDIEMYSQGLKAVDIFKSGGIDKVIQQITGEVSGFIPDVATDKGRKEIASLAHKVSKSKILIDGLGKNLADNLNAQLKPINAERKKCRDALDNLRDEIRMPLTQWESQEKEKAKAQAIAVEIENCIELAYLMNDQFDRDRKAEQDRIAAEKLEAEKRALAAQKEREAKIAQEAEDRAREEERRKAEAELAEANRKVRAAELAELKRQAAEQTAINEAKKREQDQAHKKMVNNELASKFIEIGVNEDAAKKAIKEIHLGHWPNISITY